MGTSTTVDLAKLDEIRLSHARWAGGLGLGTVFVPLADLLVMGTIWTSLTVQIGEAAGHPVDRRYAKKFAGSLVKGALFYLAGSRLGTWLVSMTGVGAPGAMAANAALNYGYTWLLGGFLIEQFKRSDVDLSGLGKSALAYLLSFGLTDVMAFQDAQDAAETASIAMDTAAADVGAVADASVAAMGAQAGLVAAAAPPPVDPAAGDAVASMDGAATSPPVGTDLRFGRSLQPLENMADWQGYQNTCGLESLENAIQAASPVVGNDVSDSVLSFVPHVAQSGYPLEQYPSLLAQQGIQSQWIPADFGSMLNAVNQPGTGVVIHGDPHFVNPTVFPNPGGYHAVYLSEPWYDAAGNAVGFVGIDSAPPDPAQRIGHWTFAQVQQMIGGARLNPWKGSVLLTRPLIPGVGA